MANLYTAGELATIIKKLGEMDTPDLGPDDDSINTYIFYFMNIAMMKLAGLANQIAYSDPVNVTSDGYVQFKKNTQNITDIFKVLEITAPDGSLVPPRTFETAPLGWWKESDNQEIHLKGFQSGYTAGLQSGNYTLKYVKYPKKVTLITDSVEFPPVGYDALIKEVLSLIKYPKNSYSGAEFMDTKAKQSQSKLKEG